MWMVVFACVGVFAVGGFLVVGFAIAFNLSDAFYKSKRECRECLRKRVEYGFNVDGKEYECIERKK